MDEHALDADADLAGVGEGADEDALDGPVEVRRAVDDDGSVAAQLQDDVLLARAGLHPPADGRAAGERQQLEAVVGDHPVAELAAHGQDAHRARRQASLGHDLGHRQHRERVLGRRLEDDRAAGGDGRRELVRGQVEREVEGADGGHRSDREAPRDAQATARGRHQVERDRLPGHPLGFLGAEAEGQHGAIDLDQRVADRLAGLEGDGPPELLASGPDARADLAQDPTTLVCRQVPGLLERGHGGVGRRVVLLWGRGIGPAGRRIRVGRVTDLQDVG